MSGQTFNNFLELLEERVKQAPNQKVFTYLKDGEAVGGSLTYQELVDESKKNAAMLQARQLKGERALLLYPQGLEFITALFGCLYAGVIAIPLYPPKRNKIDAITNIWNDCEATVLLSNTTTYTRTQKTLGGFMEGDWALTDKPFSGTFSAETILEDSVAYLQYTSGSTDQAKGVKISHQNLMANSQFLQDAFELDENDRCVSWLPFFHDMSLIDGVFQPIYSNYPIALMSPVDFVKKPLRWLKAVSNFNATRTGGSNFAYDLCVEKTDEEELKQLNLKQVKCLYNGAEPVSYQTMQRFNAHFASTGLSDRAFYPCYGMAEATLQITGIKIAEVPTQLLLDKEELSKGNVVVTSNNKQAIGVVSCGYPRVDTQVHIVNPETKDLEEQGKVGEIWVSGDSISSGYWNRDDLNNQYFQQCIQGKQGAYFRTGDLGFIANNELYVTGRMKDLIIVRGRNYYPHDIERLVQHAHPDLQVDGTIAFSVLEETEKVVVVQALHRQRIREADTKSILASIRSKIAEQLEINVDTILLTTPQSIPKTSSGKVARKLCKETFVANNLEYLDISQIQSKPDKLSQQADEDLSIISSPESIQTMLSVILAKQLKVAEASIVADTSVFDVGLDSISAVDITRQLEELLHLELDPTLFWEFETIHQIANYLFNQMASV